MQASNKQSVFPVFGRVFRFHCQDTTNSGKTPLPIQATVKRRLTTPITASKTLNIVAYSLENQRQTPFFALKKFLYYNNYRKQNR